MGDGMGVRFMVCLLCSLASPAAAVVGGAPAAPPEPDAAVVFVQRHGTAARIEGIKYDALGYYTFLGIRYAEPPLGRRRFQRPVRRYLTGDVAARKACEVCAQPGGNGRPIGVENCLCLNVYAPKMPGEEKGSPVIFFIHGGNYRSGSSSYYGGQHLAQKDTILVTAQYRLASLGFLSTGERDAAGNAGLFDLQVALQWVYDYIEFFGGDPSRVVLMGQGSGGSAASLMALSRDGREGARGVAALSGAPLSASAVRADPDKHAREMARVTGCPPRPPERLIACLRKLSMEDIVNADEKIQMNVVDTEKFLEEISGKSGAGARVEGDEDKRGLPPLVERAPANSLQSKTQRCPLLTGVTSAETSRAVFGKYSKFLKEKLSSVRDFIKKEVVGELRGLVVDLVPRSSELTPLGAYYQAVFDSSMSTIDGLANVAEATADALFNFPAYHSVSLWSKAAPAFLYSFEHKGNLTKGGHFLPGVPLADSQILEEGAVNGPAHGDELAYIFQPLDAEGRSLNESDISQTDAKVRDSFVSLMAKFAHELSPVKIENATTSVFNKFNQEAGPFIKISDEVTIEKNFRFCQMGLWGNMADRLTGAFCKNIIGALVNKVPLPKIPITVPKLPLVGPNLVSDTDTSKKKNIPKFPLSPLRL